MRRAAFIVFALTLASCGSSTQDKASRPAAPRTFAIAGVPRLLEAPPAIAVRRAPTRHHKVIRRARVQRVVVHRRTPAPAPLPVARPAVVVPQPVPARVAKPAPIRVQRPAAQAPSQPPIVFDDSG